jgi:hypothetical protein
VFLYPAVCDGLVVRKTTPVQIEPGLLRDIVDFDVPVNSQSLLQATYLDVVVPTDYRNALKANRINDAKNSPEPVVFAKEVSVDVVSGIRNAPERCNIAIVDGNIHKNPGHRRYIGGSKKIHLFVNHRERTQRYAAFVENRRWIEFLNKMSNPELVQELLSFALHVSRANPWRVVNQERMASSEEKAVH